MSVVIEFRERARGNVSVMMVLWAIAMTVILFIGVVAPSGDDTIAGFVVTAILGAYLGVRRRLGAVAVAPFISWLFAWFPMVIACMIHFGVLKGFFLGLLVITFGWMGIGALEFIWLMMVALLVRSMRGPQREASVTIIEPERH